MPRYVDFNERGKPKYQEKNSQSTGEINYENSFDMKYHTRLAFNGEMHNVLDALVRTFFIERLFHFPTQALFFK